MTIEKRIRMLLTYTGISQAELARRIGITPANLNNKLKRDRFLFSDVEKIANALNAELVCQFKCSDGTII